MAASTLAQSLIGYAPIVDQKRNAMASRVVVRPDAGVDTTYDRLYRELADVCPQGSPALLLSVEGLSVTEEILKVPAVPQIWVEMPAETMDEPGSQQLAGEMHRRGFRLVLGGRTKSPLPPELVPAFCLSLIHISADRRLNMPGPSAPPPGFKRSIPYAQVGVQSIAMMERCFATGAFAVVGWPFEDTMKHATSASTNPDFSTITRLIQLIDKGEDVSNMETLIRRDPALAYRLLRYINSPAFGLRVEIQSFRHAVMMLGYARLRRWLMLLIATSCKDANMRPLMFASFRRGLFLERLIGRDQDESIRDEVFILGVFSLLDKLFKESFSTLFSTLQVPERVQEALVERRGPYVPYLGIAESIEQGPSADLPDKLLNAVMSVEQCNQAVVGALLTPDLVST
jgi:EAL and modified HD-GYP domain-containing signal transduction protein